MSDYETQGRSGWNLGMSVLFGAVIALLAAVVYLFVALDRVQTDVAKQRETINKEVASLREASSLTVASSRRTLEAMKEELQAAQRQAAVAVGQARTDAIKKAEALNAQVQEAQRKLEAQTASQFAEVKQDAASTKTDVAGVKTDLTTARVDIEKTFAELKSVRGDMGEMSGKIATNGTELNALKALGDRNYFEFNLGRTKAPQKVGDIAVLLKKTDPKKNKFTIDLVADDKTVEKKDKGVNEPVQFYTSKARQPYELVVNKVGKDQITGYLATPKVQTGR